MLGKLARSGHLKDSQVVNGQASLVSNCTLSDPSAANISNFPGSSTIPHRSDTLISGKFVCQYSFNSVSSPNLPVSALESGYENCIA